MIAGLRRRHRWMVTVLFIVVATAFAWAMAARKTIPRASSPSGALRAGAEVERAAT